MEPEGQRGRALSRQRQSKPTGAGNASLRECPLLVFGCEGKGCDPRRKGQGCPEQGVLSTRRAPAPSHLDLNVHTMEISSQPRAPPSQRENPTSGEHLDQTATMKAQHQTRVSEGPSPQALLQEKLQIFLLEAFKCHRTTQVWDLSLFTRDRCPQVSTVGFDYPQRERMCVT